MNTHNPQPRITHSGRYYKRGWWIIRGPDNEIRLVKVEAPFARDAA